MTLAAGKLVKRIVAQGAYELKGRELDRVRKTVLKEADHIISVNDIACDEMTPEGLKSVMAQDHNADSAGLHDRYVMLSEHVSRPVDESGVYKRDDHFKHVLGGAQLQRGGQVNRAPPCDQ